MMAVDRRFDGSTGPHHRWLGPPNGSASEQIHRWQRRTNRIVDPRFTAVDVPGGWTSYRLSGVTTASGVVKATVSELGYFPRLEAGTETLATVEAGERYVVSVQCSTVKHMVGIQFHNASGAMVGSRTLGTPAASIAQVTALAPTGAVTARVYIGAPSDTAVGVKLEFSRPILETGTVPGPYFDGGTPHTI